MADKIIGLRPDGTFNPETIAAVKEIAGTGTGSVVVTDDGAGTYTVGGTTIMGLTTQGQLPAVAKKYVDDGLAGKANTTHTHTWGEVTGKPTTFTPSKHTHTTADVTGLDAALAGKAATTHTHTLADITDKPATFTPSAHTHAATDITTGTLDPARLPLSTTATAGAMSAADKTKLDGITGSGGGTSLTPTETATLATLTDALTKSATEHAAYTAYQNLLEQKVVAGKTLTTSSMEETGKWLNNYGSSVEANPALADDGYSYVRLPANNNNTNTGKPVHAYLLQPVSVVSGNTYAIRARVRATGTPGSDDYFRVMIGRLTGPTTVAYVNATSTATLVSKGVNTNGYVDMVMTWTANLTDPNIVFGVQGGNLDNDILVDKIAVLDTTGATPVTDQQITDARNTWLSASTAARAAWTNIMPVGALTTGGGVTTQTITRADYDARRAAGTLDPNVLYMVTAS